MSKNTPSFRCVLIAAVGCALIGAHTTFAGANQVPRNSRQSVSATGQRVSQGEKARISMATARATAAKSVPNGRMRSEELEREHGVLLYSFDIQKPGQRGVTEVQVDATNGRLLSSKHESPAAESKEARQEANSPRATAERGPSGAGAARDSSSRGSGRHR